MNPGRVVRYELPNLGALNFLLPTILDGGGSVSLRIDAQGKALGQAILEMKIEVVDGHDSGGNPLKLERVNRGNPKQIQNPNQKLETMLVREREQDGLAPHRNRY